MGIRRRVIGLTALVGFLAATAWAAGIVPSNCCSATCESCPITLCKGTAATESPKVDVAAPSGIAAFFSLRLLPNAETPTSVAQVTSVRSPGFRRPMRS